jgi:MFS family permease
MRKPSLLIIFITVFVDLMGFGMVLPLLPKYVRDFGAPGWLLGLIVASYSVMQFLFAPAWGRLSDRIGRRPVLLISTAGFVVSYALFAVGSGLTHGPTALAVILVSRVFSGICGANLTVAQAYIADLTPPKDRSRRMGLIGMAFGLGFIFGPAMAVGALLWLGLPGPGWFAAGICLFNLILASLYLGESLQPGTAASATPVEPGGRFGAWGTVLRRPLIGFLVVVYFLSTFAFTCFETTLGLLIAQNYQFSRTTTDGEIAIAFLFAFCGLIGAFIQGGPIGRLVRDLGEGRLIALSLLLVGISLAPLPFFSGELRASLSGLWRDPEVPWYRFLGALFTVGGPSWLLLLAALAVLSIGSGLTRPPLFGLISMRTPAHEQGATLGVAQGAGALARIFGPIFASATYDWHPSFPYLICAAIAFGAGIVSLVRLKNQDHRADPAPAPKPA